MNDKKRHKKPSQGYTRKWHYHNTVNKKCITKINIQFGLMSKADVMIVITSE